MADDSSAAEDSAAALLAMSMSDGQPGVPKMATRSTKRNKRVHADETSKSVSPQKQSRAAVPVKLPFAALPPKSNKQVAQSNGLRLRNLLKLPKAHKWVCYEWFYSNLDQALLLGENDFQAVLKENFPELQTQTLGRAAWCKIRRLMGKPRRCSSAFFTEERRVLEQKRQKIRMIQQRKITDITETDMKDLPEEIPMLLVIGTEVTALLRNPQDGLYTGTIDAVNTADNTYRITFDKPGLGTHTIPDYEVLSNKVQDTLPLTSFQQKVRARFPLSTPPRITQLQLDNDPLLGFSPVNPRMLSEEGGTYGGFPIKFLLQVTKLSKILMVKKEKLAAMKELNGKAEKLRSYHEPLSTEFQKRYAYMILELEELNRRLNDHLSAVQLYSKDVSPYQGLSGLDNSHETKLNCDVQAKQMVEQRCTELNRTIRSESMKELITNLSSILLQLKTVGENDVNSFDMRTVQQSLEQLKLSVDTMNTSSFRNNVEVHVNHIQSGLTRMGNLHAFNTSTHTFL